MQEQRRIERIVGTATPHELYRVRRAAGLMQMTLSEFVRECVLPQATSVIETYDPLPQLEGETNE